MARRNTVLIVVGLILALFGPVQAQNGNEATAPEGDVSKHYSVDEYAEAIAAAKRAVMAGLEPQPPPEEQESIR